MTAQELMNNQEFIKKMDACTKAEEYQAVMAEFGIESSLSEINEAIEKINATGELSEMELGDVAGGTGELLIAGAILIWYLNNYFRNKARAGH